MKRKIVQIRGRKICARYSRKLTFEKDRSCESCLYFIHIDGQDFCRLVREERVLKRI